MWSHNNPVNVVFGAGARKKYSLNLPSLYPEHAVVDPDLTAGADRLEAFLEGLGVATRPEAHGVEPEEWKGLAEEALAGERGRNFLGNRSAVLGGL